MLFRLENGALETLDDSLTDLSVFFTNIRELVNPLNTLEETLRKGPYKKIRNDFIELLKKSLAALNNGCQDLTDEYIHQLSNPDSPLSLHLKTQASDETMRNCLDFVHVNIDELLSPAIHRMKFVKDKTLLLVLEYLKIPCPRRSDTMFESLPFSYQGRDHNTDFRSLLDPCLHPYIDFIEKLNDEMFMDVSKAALSLGIKSLTTLIGCQMARLVNTLSVRDIRTRFGVPDDKFIDSTKEKLDQILEQKAWLKCAPTTQ